MKYIFFSLALFAFAGLRAQIAETQSGRVQGNLNGNIYEFLGIPFARPPVDSLRWRAPQNPAAWSGVLQTQAFAPACPQKNYTQGDSSYSYQGKEDCLYLNVWTPKLGAGGLPVLVFIHGGGNQQGSAGELAGGTHLYDGKNLAARGNAVAVTIQYRLGPLGFLVHPGLEAENAKGKAGNYAVLDQILALQWVKNNIANFGGDTSKIMIFGESAGGVDVGNLLATPLAAGLFQRACIESAGPTLSAYFDARNKGVAFVDTFAPAGSDAQKIAFMRTLPADSLVRYEKSPLQGGIVQANWQPVLDQVVFSGFPMQVFQSGNFNKVPLIIGSNSEEISLSAPPTVAPFMVTALVNTYVPPAYRPQVLALYPPGNNNTEARASYVNLLTDAQFTTIARRTAQCVSRNQSAPVWRYFFTHKHTIPQLEALGSYHGMELFYVFNNWENTPLGSGPLFHPQDASVQDAMLHYWVNFAASGNPNGPGLGAWPQYDGASDCYLEIKAAPDGSQCGLRTAQTDLWDAMSGFIPCKASSVFAEPAAEPLRIYPNPANTYIRIDHGSARYCIVDVTGTILKQDVSGPEGIFVGDLPPGIYFLTLEGRTGRFVRGR